MKNQRNHGANAVHGYQSNAGMMRSGSFDSKRFHALSGSKSVSALQASTTQVPLGSSLHSDRVPRYAHGGMQKSGSSSSLWRSSHGGSHADLHGRRAMKNQHMHQTSGFKSNTLLQSVAADEEKGGRTRKPKIVFLDVDGVLHSIRVTRQEQLFNPQKMALLRKIITNTDAQIVMSSAWRRTAPTLRLAYQMLNKHGIDSPIDITPDYGVCGKRSNEILYWVDKHQLTNWVALDDLDLGTGEPRLKGHFIRTNPLIGLTQENVDLAIRWLNSDC